MPKKYLSKKNLLTINFNKDRYGYYSEYDHYHNDDYMTSLYLCMTEVKRVFRTDASKIKVFISESKIPNSKAVYIKRHLYDGIYNPDKYYYTMCKNVKHPKGSLDGSIWTFLTRAFNPKVGEIFRLYVRVKEIEEN